MGDLEEGDLEQVDIDEDDLEESDPRRETCHNNQPKRAGVGLLYLEEEGNIEESDLEGGCDTSRRGATPRGERTRSQGGGRPQGGGVRGRHQGEQPDTTINPKGARFTEE